MSAYSDFTCQFIAGEWRAGTSTQNVIRDENPYNGKLLTTIQGASVQDVDDAYAAAIKVQPEWSHLLPRERAEYLNKAARVFEKRHAEMVDWVIREAGATHYWAEMICRHAYAVKLPVTQGRHRV